MLGGQAEEGAGTCWGQVVCLSPGAQAIPVQILPGMRLVDREVVVPRRQEKATQTEK